jgi:hypothetical protein
MLSDSDVEGTAAAGEVPSTSTLRIRKGLADGEAASALAQVCGTPGWLCDAAEGAAGEPSGLGAAALPVVGR